MIKKILLAIGLFASAMTTRAQVWQWCVSVDRMVSSETGDHPQAYLWIPENCKQVRGVVFAQHNMIEEGMLEHPVFRKTMTELGFAEVWVTPGIDMPFDFNKDAGKNFQRMMDLLAEESGYAELKTAPVIPIGHSAYATFPWNFAAWNPQRTLALVSVHGDAPQTPLTGYGGKNVEWGGRNIDGVPALFIMGEYEWWEDRITPGFDYVKSHPASVVSFFADAGHGHFDYSEAMIRYVCLFIKKAAAARIGTAGRLKPVDPQQGWLMDRWRKDSLPFFKAAPYSKYRGDRYTASWVFDKEMADVAERSYAKARGKKEQYIGFVQKGIVLQPQKSHATFSGKFSPLADGISFKIKAFFADSTKAKTGRNHAVTPLVVSGICGPVKKIDDSTFRIHFGKLGFNNKKRSNDIWLLAYNDGDDAYKSAVQQLDMHIPLVNAEGAIQTIRFPELADVSRSVRSVPLHAVSSASLPVYYYIKQGPAYIEGTQLIITNIPPKAKYPVKITVVAWQYGIAGKIQSAPPVVQAFYIR
ncbi:hypothetical protein [Niabella drilacis]|uniref:Alpha/beta hydrolase family protein n=1 Tax=Niabella drilacis (strain DSM 25811 / CCM 8410 / CCUG 62505 / LMG 26954 / E90) TaxID=1285928 RepID=A0A1G6S6Y5_NIADE|nr:hypothetical protein [Niabella drilacis]SDD11915.1 hypothetical protein SAMN04487894_10695 [Niabella drilacis]